jgi:hypothetical protein
VCIWTDREYRSRQQWRLQGTGAALSGGGAKSGETRAVAARAKSASLGLPAPDSECFALRSYSVSSNVAVPETISHATESNKTLDNAA